MPNLVHYGDVLWLVYYNRCTMTGILKLVYCNGQGRRAIGSHGCSYFLFQINTNDHNNNNKHNKHNNKNKTGLTQMEIGGCGPFQVRNDPDSQTGIAFHRTFPRRVHQSLSKSCWNAEKTVKGKPPRILLVKNTHLHEYCTKATTIGTGGGGTNTVAHTFTLRLPYVKGTICIKKMELLILLG